MSRKKKAKQLKLGPPITPMTKQEINTLARRVVTNDVFITSRVDEAELAFGMLFAFMEDPLPENLGGVWEAYSKAGPRSINGLPMFFSMHMVAKEDLKPLDAEIKKMQKALGVPSGS